jgi:hypothetical protein
MPIYTPHHHDQQVSSDSSFISVTEELNPFSLPSSLTSEFTAFKQTINKLYYFFNFNTRILFIE